MVGSLLMLVAILYLAVLHGRATGAISFDLLQLYEFSIAPAAQLWLFAAFALAFAIKVPMFPLHTWLPDAHVEAPTGGSVILAGVLLKMGTYGFLRFALPLFPTAATVAAALHRGARGRRHRLRRAGRDGAARPEEAGRLLVGQPPRLRHARPRRLNAEGVAGSVYQMLNHGLSTGALFLAVGVIYERRHTRLIADFGGLWKQRAALRGVLPDRDALVGRACRG